MSTKPRAPLDAAAVQQVLRSKRFLAADRAALDLGEIATWDKFLLREHRLLVPIDVAWGVLLTALAAMGGWKAR